MTPARVLAVKFPPIVKHVVIVLTTWRRYNSKLKIQRSLVWVKPIFCRLAYGADDIESSALRSSPVLLILVVIITFERA